MKHRLYLVYTSPSYIKGTSGNMGCSNSTLIGKYMDALSGLLMVIEYYHDGASLYRCIESIHPDVMSQFVINQLISEGHGNPDPRECSFKIINRMIINIYTIAFEEMSRSETIKLLIRNMSKPSLQSAEPQWQVIRYYISSEILGYIDRITSPSPGDPELDSDNRKRIKDTIDTVSNNYLRYKIGTTEEIMGYR